MINIERLSCLAILAATWACGTPHDTEVSNNDAISSPAALGSEPTREAKEPSAHVASR